MTTSFPIADTKLWFMLTPNHPDKRLSNTGNGLPLGVNVLGCNVSVEFLGSNLSVLDQDTVSGYASKSFTIPHGSVYLTVEKTGSAVFENPRITIETTANLSPGEPPVGSVTIDESFTGGSADVLVV